jgi:hypothetical protein
VTLTRRDLVKRAAVVLGASVSPLAAILPVCAAGAGSGIIRLSPSADLTGASDQKALEDAIAALEGAAGGIVELAAGSFYLRRRLRIRNRVTLRGINGRTTEINLGSDFADEYLFEFWNESINSKSGKLESVSQFNCRLDDLSIRGRVSYDVARVLEKTLAPDEAAARVAAINRGIKAVVWARSWNEQCGLRNVLIWEYLKHAVLFTDAYGGTATFELRECEFQSSEDASAEYAGVMLTTDNRVGLTNALLHHVIVSGPPLNAGYRCIEARNGINLVGTGLHVEACEHGIWMAGRSHLTLSGYTGSPTHVVNLITCAEDFVGTVFGAGVFKAGATGQVLRDLKRRRNVATDRNPLIFP